MKLLGDLWWWLGARRSSSISAEGAHARTQAAVPTAAVHQKGERRDEDRQGESAVVAHYSPLSYTPPHLLDQDLTVGSSALRQWPGLDADVRDPVSYIVHLLLLLSLLSLSFSLVFPMRATNDRVLLFHFANRKEEEKWWNIE